MTTYLTARGIAALRRARNKRGRFVAEPEPGPRAGRRPRQRLLTSTERWLYDEGWRLLKGNQRIAAEVLEAMPKGQRCAAAVLYADKVRGQARARQRAGKKVAAGKGKAAAEAAAHFKVSTRSVEYAAAVKRRSARIFAHLAHGRITLAVARKRAARRRP